MPPFYINAVGLALFADLSSGHCEAGRRIQQRTTHSTAMPRKVGPGEGFTTRVLPVAQGAPRWLQVAVRAYLQLDS